MSNTQFEQQAAKVVNYANQCGSYNQVNDIDNWKGQYMKINNQEMVNLGTCGYLGLETDKRLINRAIDYTKRFGTQFSVSRAYLTSSLLSNMEKQLARIFNNHPALVYSSTSLAHTSVVPRIVNPNDVILFDKQAHFSVYISTLVIPHKVPFKRIEHNNMSMLEDQIKAFKDKHEKIWYLADGVYSMFGDFMDVDAINDLMTRYEQLHIYVDDAHGAGWAGKNGTGVVFDKIIHKDRLVLATTMAKGFGSIGGVVVFPKDKKLYIDVKTFGGPLSYSHPLPPAVLGAGMATAEILLSPEVKVIQKELSDRVSYCNELLEASGMPILSNPDSPIKFIGVGKVETGFTIHKKLMKSGFFTNASAFPVVPINQTGIRFVITRHINMDQIKQFVDTLQRHYYETLKAEATEVDMVRKEFKLPLQHDIAS